MATAAGGLAISATGAHAQVANTFLLDRYFQEGVPGQGPQLGTTVLSRQRPQYDALGVRVGDFVIRPAFNESVGYNSNVLGQRPAKGTPEINTSGTLAFGSDWARNSIGGEFSFDDRRTPSVTTQDRTNWSASLGGTYQIGRDLLTLTGSHFQLHQDPTGVDAAQFNQTGKFTTAPIPFTLDDVRASYATEFGRFGITPQIDYLRMRFDNLKLASLNGALVPPENPDGTVLGVPVVQSYRNRDLVEGTVTGRYEFAPLRNALLVVREINTNYVSSSRDQFGPNRSGNAHEVLAGLDYTANGVWRYRALVGYEIRDFQNFKSHSAPIVEANVIWQPTILTTVTGRVQRSIEDANDESVSGYTYTLGRIGVDHEYARNILLSGYVAVQRADYLQTVDAETFYGAGAGVSWLIDRNVRLGLTYDVTDRQGSKGFGTDYMQNVGMLQLHLAY